jgi:hypothetical protein
MSYIRYMKMINQLRVLLSLNSGRYKVEQDKIISFFRGERLELKGTQFESGYRQVTLNKWYPHLKVTAYVHQIIYLANNGTYDEGLEIDHLDRNPRNNLPDNLACKTSAKNSENSIGRQPIQKTKSIRNKEIKKIKELRANGNSQASIARLLGLNRLSVRYIIKRIEGGHPLKYEKD